MPGCPRARARARWCWRFRSARTTSSRGSPAYADEVVCLETPAFFFAVGQGYRNFTQTSDDEVVALLDRARDNFAEAAAIDAAADPPLRDEEVWVLAGPVTVAGHLTIPENPRGIVVFAHGSGSSRHSPRNRYVAEVLNRAGLATLLFDLLTPAEERNRANVFDIEVLAGRLVDVSVGWLATPTPRHYPWAISAPAPGRARPGRGHRSRVKVDAVVSRGGRPDLAGRYLAEVAAPTLLIVGGRDEVVLELNRRAQAAIPGQCELTVVPGATHLFEEPGTLETGRGAGPRLVHRPLEPRCRQPVDRIKHDEGQRIGSSQRMAHNESADCGMGDDPRQLHRAKRCSVRWKAGLARKVARLIPLGVVKG